MFEFGRKCARKNALDAALNEASNFPFFAFGPEAADALLKTAMQGGGSTHGVLTTQR